MRVYSVVVVMVIAMMSTSLGQKQEASERFFKGLGGKGMDGLSGLPIGSYPLWKFHKFDGLSLKPVPIGLELGAGIPPPPLQYMNQMPLPYEGQGQSYGGGQGQQSYGGGQQSYGGQPNYPPPSYQQPSYQPSYSPPQNYQPPSYPPQSNYGGGYGGGKCKTVCDDQYANPGYRAYQPPSYDSPAPPASYASTYGPPPSYGPSSSYSAPTPAYTSYAPAQEYQQPQAPPQYEQPPQPQYSAPVYEQPQQYQPPPPPQQPPQSYGQQPSYETPASPPAYSSEGYKKRRSSSVTHHSDKLKDVKERSDSPLDKSVMSDELQDLKF